MHTADDTSALGANLYFIYICNIKSKTNNKLPYSSQSFDYCLSRGGGGGGVFFTTEGR